MNDAAELSTEAELADGLLGYLPQIIYQRRWFVLIPFAASALTGVGLAYGLPAHYQSSATVIVESKELPEAIAAASVTDLIDQRIAKIKQQILSRPGLIELIQANDLYRSERGKKSLSSIIEMMRDATAITPVTADIDKFAARRGGSSTIAFSISFTYSDPAKAQAVTQQFTEKLLKLDSSQLSAQADATVGFLRDQASQIQGQITEIEGKIADIKARNGLALSRIGGFIPSTSSYDVQIAQLQRENTELQGRLNSNSTNADDRVSAAESALAAAQALYSDNHPDVIAAKQKLTEARAAAKSAGGGPRNNPAITAQIAANNRTIATLTSAKSADMSRASAAVSAQSGAPLIEENIRQLEAKADGLRGNYERISGNLLAAEAAQKMDAEQRGERLVLVDPPTLPDEPNSPNRGLLVIGGFALGIVIGFGLALLIELFRRPIRGAAALQSMLGVGPLVVIPTLRAKRSGGTKRRRRKRLFGRRKAAHA